MLLAMKYHSYLVMEVFKASHSGGCAT